LNRVSLQNYHLDADNNVVPVAGTGSPLIAPNQMSRAKVRSVQSMRGVRTRMQAAHAMDECHTAVHWRKGRSRGRVLR
jgi:hypothetical protein